MSIFVNNDTKVVVQGITGREGQFHARQCIAYGTDSEGKIDYVKGANIAGFVKVADAMLEQGVI